MVRQWSGCSECYCRIHLSLCSACARRMLHVMKREVVVVVVLISLLPTPVDGFGGASIGAGGQ